MKIASGVGKPSSASGARPSHHPQTRHPERVGVGRDARRAGGVGLHGHGPAGRVRPQPFQRDRAVARADVPQQLAAPRPEQRERDGADLALGELAVVVVGVVGQARGRAPGPVPTQVSATRFNGSPGGCAQSRAVPSRRRSAGPPSCSRTVRAESPYPSSASSAASAPRRARVLAEHQHAGPRREHPAHRGERPRDRADDLDGVRRPPHPGAGQRHRRRVGEHLDRPEHPRERGADAVVHRVAAGQRAHPASASSAKSPGSAGSIGEGQGRASASVCPATSASCRGPPSTTSASRTAARPGSASPAQPSAPMPTTVTPAGTVTARCPAAGRPRSPAPRARGAAAARGSAGRSGARPRPPRAGRCARPRALAASTSAARRAR